MSLLTAVWLLLAVGAPVVADAAIAIAAPEPSRAAFIDRQRKITTAMTAQRDSILAALFAKRSDLAGASAQIPSLDGVSRNTFFTPVIERDLESMQMEFEHARALRARASSVASYLVPTIGFAEALTILAGTGAQRHRQFEAQIRAYQMQLRNFFYPRIQREIAAPTPRAIAGSMGRFNFSDFENVPSMHFTDSSSDTRLLAVMPLVIWLLMLSILLTGLGLSRLRRWPADI